MSLSPTQVFAAIAMLVAAVVLVVVYRAYLARNSERRMRKMLESAGLDPALASSGEIPTIMKDVRQRCRSCSSEDVCERWLEGKEAGNNAFCPNAKVFDILNRYS